MMKKFFVGFLAFVGVLFMFVIPAEASTIPSVSYRSHVQSIGWQGYAKDGATAGTIGKSLRLEAVNVKLENLAITGGIQYRSHVQSVGWQGFVSNNAQSGTTGQSLRLEAIQIKLTGELANQYDIHYRAHVQNIGWQSWVKNGDTAGTEGQSKRLEAIEIKLVKKAAITIISTTNINKFYAIDQDSRTDILVDDVLAKTFPVSAKTFHGVVVQSDKEVRTSDGNTYVHIKVNNTWKWILKVGLSWEKGDETGLVNAQPILEYNCYDKSGTIYYKSDSAFTTQLDAAASVWNSKLGTIFIKTNDINKANLYVRDNAIGTGKGKYLANTYYSIGLMFVNTSYIGKNAGGYNFKSEADIQDIFVHELGHSLGLSHTGKNVDNNISKPVYSWSWSTFEDVMWASKTGGNAKSAHTLTTNDVNAAKLVRTLQRFDDTANPANYKNKYSQSSVDEDSDLPVIIDYPGEQ